SCMAAFWLACLHDVALRQHRARLSATIFTLRDWAGLAEEARRIGRVPATLEALRATAPDAFPRLSSRDAWGAPLQYVSDGERWCIVSFGAGSHLDEGVSRPEDWCTLEPEPTTKFC